LSGDVSGKKKGERIRMVM